MKAAVCYEYNKPLVIEDVEIEKPQKYEVKVKLAATGICHSDIHCIKGEFGPPLPFIPGHESSGYVDEIGEEVTSFKIGDPVIVTLIASCGKCLYCSSGSQTMCDYNWPLIRGTRVRNKSGQALYTNMKMANFAEYVIVHESQLVKMPDDLPMDVASLLACCVITGFGAVVNRAQVKPLSSVAVIGTGGIGLNSIQGALIAGARTIIGVDISDDKLRSALDFGATEVVNAGKEDPIQSVKKITDGRGADCVIVSVGNTKAMQQGFAMTGRKGTMVVLGIAPNFEKLSIPSFELIADEKVITGSAMGSTRISTDIPRLLDLYKQGRIKLDELITGRYKLEEVNAAIESTERGDALRNVIIF